MTIKKSAGMTSVSSYLNMAAASFARLKTGTDIPEVLKTNFEAHLIAAGADVEAIRKHLIKIEGGPPDVG
jgi:hypothetical protein